MLYIVMYLFAIVSANLLIAQFGKAATLWVGFLFIGFDLTARDKLHEAWSGRGLVWKMGLLIAAGSALTWIVNRNAGQIAVASMLAFTAAAIADTITYHLLREKSYLVKVNGSNVVSALIDSVVFFMVAFGGLSWFTFAQFGVKVFGGMLWSLVLRNRKAAQVTA